MTYVDDNLWLPRGSAAVDAIAIALLFLCALGLPIAWRKCHGGISVGWVGYRLEMQKKLLGIGVNKTRWLIDWVGKTLQDAYVVVADVSSVLGRFSFAFAALEPLRPFLGPLYAWTSAVKERAARLKLPKALRLVLSFLVQVLENGGNLQRVGAKQQACREVFRTDARAEGDDVYIGGWAVADAEATKYCRWPSEKLTRFNAPWAFLAGDPSVP